MNCRFSVSFTWRVGGYLFLSSCGRDNGYPHSDMPRPKLDVSKDCAYTSPWLHSKNRFMENGEVNNRCFNGYNMLTHARILEAKRMAQAGRNLVEEKFSIVNREVIDSLEALYEEALKRYIKEDKHA